MWYIERVWINDENGGCQERHFIFHERPRERRRIITVQLRDSVSGSKVELSNWQSWNNFEAELKSYMPYGYVPGKFPDGQEADAALFVGVDELSVKFLDHIKSIHPIDPKDIDIHKHVALLKQSMTVWNNPGNIIEWVAGQYICPLFQTVCFLSDGWYREKFYMRTGHHHDGVGFCVEFKDIQKTRAFVAKASCMGYNPIAEHIVNRLN